MLQIFTIAELLKVGQRILSDFWWKNERHFHSNGCIW